MQAEKKGFFLSRQFTNLESGVFFNILTNFFINAIIL